MRVPRFVIECGCLMAALLGVSCQDAPSTPGDTYPTTMNALPPDQLQALRSEYAALNPEYCTTLDEFGFSQWSYTCGKYGVIDCSIDSLILLARSGIVRNSQFTGVKDIDQLRVWNYDCAPSGFRVRFDDQIFKDLHVHDTHIMVRLSDDGVYWIGGHHYPDITIPKPAVPPQRAQESILGLVIPWEDFAGTLHEYVVGPNSFYDDPYREILPRKLEDRIELRVVWSVPVGPGWIVYVDTMTGEQLGVQQLFVT